MAHNASYLVFHNNNNNNNIITLRVGICLMTERKADQKRRKNTLFVKLYTNLSIENNNKRDRQSKNPLYFANKMQ